MKMVILTTGGTIQGIDPSSQSEISLEKLLEPVKLSFTYQVKNIVSKDSRSITDKDRELLLRAIQESNSDKILITHGTYTMAETAKYIGRQELDKTIVLVGSFILGSSSNSDAPFNLGFAIGSLQFLKPDVYIAMHGKVFHWSSVTKNLVSEKFESNE
ncbi:asparaginase domain-containing protein [Christiangramia echinicola]|uniref:asparaginase domain-containing protein n=1 Tax=Christiangramia echinicola TaxID=279359 RepID=UPI0004263C82|nr:asparaginase domain-containing protein [Christiangramia echinicola]